MPSRAERLSESIAAIAPLLTDETPLRLDFAARIVFPDGSIGP